LTGTLRATGFEACHPDCQDQYQPTAPLHGCSPQFVGLVTVALMSLSLSRMRWPSLPWAQVESGRSPTLGFPRGVLSPLLFRENSIR
jgi:hypothetical protein